MGLTGPAKPLASQAVHWFGKPTTSTTVVVVVLVFYGPSGHFGRSQLTYPHVPGQVTST